MPEILRNLTLRRSEKLLTSYPLPRSTDKRCAPLVCARAWPFLNSPCCFAVGRHLAAICQVARVQARDLNEALCETKTHAARFEFCGFRAAPAVLSFAELGEGVWWPGEMGGLGHKACPVPQGAALGTLGLSRRFRPRGNFPRPCAPAWPRAASRGAQEKTSTAHEACRSSEAASDPVLLIDGWDCPQPVRW